MFFIDSKPGIPKGKYGSNTPLRFSLPRLILVNKKGLENQDVTLAH